MSKPYRLEYCLVCKRQLIVQNVDGWTGKELPRDGLYVCDACKREHEKEQRENMSEYERRTALMFANYVTGNKCKRHYVLPCEICKAVYGDCEGY